MAVSQPDCGTLQGEVYWKFAVWEQTGRQGLYLTPDLQYLRHSSFDPSIDHAWVVGAQLGYEFCFAKRACL